MYCRGEIESCRLTQNKVIQNNEDLSKYYYRYYTKVLSRAVTVSDICPPIILLISIIGDYDLENIGPIALIILFM